MGAHVSSLTGSYVLRLDRSDWTADSRPMKRRAEMSDMRSANERVQPTDRQTTAFTTERQETVRRGLRILARMIARAHLRRQASRSLPALRRPEQTRTWPEGLNGSDSGFHHRRRHVRTHSPALCPLS